MDDYQSPELINMYTFLSQKGCTSTTLVYSVALAAETNIFLRIYVYFEVILYTPYKVFIFTLIQFHKIKCCIYIHTNKRLVFVLLLIV